jgi:orotidine 5'-phosphate decarboxylase subfamily 2
LTEFQEKVREAQRRKDTILCVGLDPALPGQRKGQVIPDKYLGADENLSRLQFCLDTIEQTSEYASVYKPNYQYVAGLTAQDHRRLVATIKKAGALAILDCKTNDIGDTLDSALFHFGRWGYDAITFNPFMGNLALAVTEAHKLKPQLAILCLVLTSNPEAVTYQKRAAIDGQTMFLATAKEVHDADADGVVVGATGHVGMQDIKAIRRTIGPDVIMLVPGVGAQKGDPEKAIIGSGPQLILNVGRDIIYSENPSQRAKSYCDLFRELSRKNWSSMRS